MRFPLRPRRLLAALLLSLAAAPLSAQRMGFSGVPWGAPADTVRARLEARGYTFERALDTGDHLYLRADSAWLRADLRGGRAVGFLLVDPARGAAVDARYATLADSLRGALGAPEVTEQKVPYATWAAGLSVVELSVDGHGALRRVELAWRAPGWMDEMARRRKDPPLPAGFTLVDVSPYNRLAVDTTGARGERGRFRIEYPVPVTPTVAGQQQDPMDAVEYEMDVDCAGRRTRLVSRTTFLEGRQLASHRPAGQPWAVPQADGHYARGRDALCRLRRGGG